MVGELMVKKNLSPRAKELEAYLQNHLAPLKVELRFNKNRSTYLSGTKNNGVYQISIHQVFIEAPEEIWQMLAKFYVRATKKTRFALEQYIHGLPPEVWLANSRKAPKVAPEGNCHHLIEVMRRAIELGFEGDYPRELPQVGWSRRGNVKDGISRLGSYDDDSHIIRISYRLDDEEVPFDFVASIVFHELLHGVHRPEVTEDCQRRVHTKDFSAAEKKYPHYKWAREWEKNHLEAVLRKQRRQSRAK